MTKKAKRIIAIIMTMLAVVLVGMIALFFSPSGAFGNPDDAVPPTDDGSVGIYASNGKVYRDPDDNTTGLSDDEPVRSEQGRVSQLSTTTHNPYNKQIRLQIDMGSEFADFDGCEFTEGYIYKVTPGGTVKLPKLRARDGYYFVGWGQGGVSREPTWDIFTTEVQVSDDTSNGKNTSIYALYADEEGNGYCTCGAYEQGIYESRLDQIKANNAEYNGETDFTNTPLLPMLIALIVLAFVFVPLCARIFRKEDDAVRSEQALDVHTDELDK